MPTAEHCIMAQVTSLYASFNAGKFTNSPDGTRTTISWLVPDSPGPSLNVIAARYARGHGVMTAR